MQSRAKAQGLDPFGEAGAIVSLHKHAAQGAFAHGRL